MLCDDMRRVRKRVAREGARVEKVCLSTAEDVD